MPAVTTFLMFSGQAQEAMNFYVSLFPGSEVTSISRYGENQGGAPGSVRHATFSLGGRAFQCIDSPVKHAFTFTPAVSLHVACETPEEVDRLFAKLSEGGGVLMPPGTYDFSKRYAWVNDRFGVSWQLMLVEA